MQEHKFLLFGDNIWEAKSIIELMRKYCKDYFDRIELIGCPSLPIYILRYKNKKIKIECRGNYDNWRDLPDSVKRYINLFDKPDAVLYSVNKKKIICAAEFTETVSVGNSQWQRSGRVVASTILNIPFLAVYPCVAEDRSQNTLREPTSLLTELFLKLSKDDPENPTLLVLKGDPYLSSLNKKRLKDNLNIIKRPDGEKLTAFWFTYRILAELGLNNKNLNLLEEEIYRFMFQTLKEKVKKNKKIIERVDKDIPFWKRILNNPDKINNLRSHTLSDLCFIDWKPPSGKILNKSHFKNNFIRHIVNSKGNILKTYVSRGKHCIVDSKYTPYIEQKLLEFYPPLNKYQWSKGILNSKLPTAFISLQGWQQEGKMLSDPNTGEAVAFPSLFNSLEEKKANIIFFIYGKPNKKWLSLYENPKKTNVLIRTIKELGDILCIDINNGGNGKPLSIKIR